MINKHLESPELDCSATLGLADGSFWSFIGGDTYAIDVVASLKKAMQLKDHAGSAHRLFIKSRSRKKDSAAEAKDFRKTSSTGLFEVSDKNHIIYTLRAIEEQNESWIHLSDLSLFIGQQSEHRGGLLIHGALAERGGYGVILAGPPNVGKTTASRRLKSPWRSLSDDFTLVVCNRQGQYLAHPWPTWSQFRPGGPGGSWDVQRAIPLKGIFFLVQSEKDCAQSVGKGQATCLIVETAELSSWMFSENNGKEKVRAWRRLRFDNICSLANSVPCYLLYLSLASTFWLDIERSIFKYLR